jgi:hypothetical protein
MKLKLMLAILLISNRSSISESNEIKLYRNKEVVKLCKESNINYKELLEKSSEDTYKLIMPIMLDFNKYVIYFPIGFFLLNFISIIGVSSYCHKDTANILDYKTLLKISFGIYFENFLLIDVITASYFIGLYMLMARYRLTQFMTIALSLPIMVLSMRLYSELMPVLFSQDSQLNLKYLHVSHIVLFTIYTLMYQMPFSVFHNDYNQLHDKIETERQNDSLVKTIKDANNANEKGFDKIAGLIIETKNEKHYGY